MCAEDKGHACRQRNSGKQGETRQEVGKDGRKWVVKNVSRRKMGKRIPSSAPRALIPSKMARRRPHWLGQPLPPSQFPPMGVKSPSGGQKSIWSLQSRYSTTHIATRRGNQRRT
jgi:hypothetical protein